GLALDCYSSEPPPFVRVVRSACRNREPAWTMVTLPCQPGDYWRKEMCPFSSLMIHRITVSSHPSVTSHPRVAPVTALLELLRFEFLSRNGGQVPLNPN